MLNVPVDELDSSLRNFYTKFLEKKTESLRIQISDSPTQYPTDLDFTRLVVGTRKRRVLVGIILMSWYASEEIRFLLQLALEEIKLEEGDLDLGRLLLTSKSYSLAWLQEQEWWNESDFFGNVLDKELILFWNRLSWYRLSSKRVKRYTGYCRGYRDSNRRAPSPLPRELVARFSVEEEFQREERRDKIFLYWVRRIERRILSYSKS